MRATHTGQELACFPDKVCSFSTLRDMTTDLVQSHQIAEQVTKQSGFRKRVPLMTVGNVVGYVGCGTDHHTKRKPLWPVWLDAGVALPTQCQQHTVSP